MPPKKNPSTPPTHLFEKYLAGEAPVSIAMAEQLCAAAWEFYQREPWQLMEEGDLVFVDAGTGGLPYRTPYVCSVMGVLGQVFELVVYLGAEGYQFFRTLQESVAMSAGEFFGGNNSITVEFVPRKEMQQPDRELLRAAGPQWAKSSRVPVFRSTRPGYHAWYPNQQEAEVLAEALAAMNWLIATLNAEVEPIYWQQEDLFPRLTPHPGGGYEVSTVKPLEAPIQMPRIPTIDKAQVHRILARISGETGVLQVDQFLCAAMIGEKNGRKSCARIALVLDAKTGMAFPPEAAGPDQDPGELLVRVVLAALESGAPRPTQIQVRNRETQLLLEPLAAELGAGLKVKATLKPLDMAKRKLMEMMGDPGDISLER